MRIFSRFFKIETVLKNNGEKPYTNITIELHSKMEKEMKIEYEKNIEIPEKPKAISDFTSITNGLTYTPSVSRNPNEKYLSIEKQENKNNNDWYLGYQVEKIRHNDVIVIPYPIMIWIPEKPKTKKIIFKITFTQDEPGKIKEQKLEINIPV